MTGLRSIFVLFSTVMVISSGCSAPEPEQRLEFSPGQFVSAKRCGACHKDIYTAWRGSLHAAATEDPLFKASFEESREVIGEGAREFCLICHAPTVLLTGDYELKQEVTREGVHCDFCHSLKATDRSNRKNPFVLETGPVKLGPIPDASSTGHDVMFSEFHTTSLQCAGCHEYRNANGVTLLTTYSEWEQYKQRGGDKTCQQCHMPQVLANIVDPKVKRVEGAFVNLHLMPGGHSREQLAKSLRLRIMEMTKSSGRLLIKVKVSNVGAGHAVPTGSPTRKVILNLDISTAGGQQFHHQKVYQRVVMDGRGQEIRKDSRVFTEAQTIERDTRVAPGEERIEEFLQSVPVEENVKVTATLTYVYSPHNRKETETRVSFMSETKELLSTWKR